MKNIKVCKTYATVFFNKAVSDKVLEKVLEEFGLLKDIFESNKKLASYFASPLFSLEEKMKVIALCKLHPVSNELLHILLNNNKAAYFAEIYDRMLTLKIEKEGKVRATLLSASKMNDKEVETCTKILEKKLGKKFDIDHKVDETLIGGVMLKFGSMMYDASVAGALRQLKNIRV